jgi:hypothetical protein
MFHVEHPEGPETTRFCQIEASGELTLPHHAKRQKHKTLTNNNITPKTT